MQKSLHDQSPNQIPRPALWLGVGGLIPFLALPVLVALDGAFALPEIVKAHATVPALALYAAVILSFMGGAQWGVAMRSVDETTAVTWRRYGVSVVPAILAWVALLLPMRAGLITLSTGFVLLLIYDLWTVRQDEVPGWYERFRLGLTTVVVISLTITLVALTQ